MSALEAIRKKLSKYRDLLANLSRRNRELYFRESRGFTVNLTRAPNVEAEYRETVNEHFQPMRFSCGRFSEVIEHGSLDLTRHFLLGEVSNQDLIKRLDKVRLADDKFQREFGLSGAWLLGPFLLWRDRADYKIEDLLISPIFKLPVDVVKDKKKNWTLRLEDTQLRMNPSLKLALKQRWGIEVPEIFQSDSPPDAVAELRSYLSQSGKDLVDCSPDMNAVPAVPKRFKVTKDEDGEIISREPIKLEDALSSQDLELYRSTTHKQFSICDVIYVDQLNASRTVLIRDYDEILTTTCPHPILNELFLGKVLPEERIDIIAKVRELDSYKERDNHFVVNIDSTQHRAIDRATAARAIVIQGPPGTGKSQTITNLIADNLAKGKRVLFVSEKRPALDVVFSRLQQASLDSQAVLIHSSELNKQDLYTSFLELSTAVPSPQTDKSWDRVAAELDELKKELNSYYEVLATEHVPSGLTIADLLVLLPSIEAVAPTPGIYQLLGKASHDELTRLCADLSDLQAMIKGVPSYWDHPWKQRKQDVIYTETLFTQFANLASRITSAEASYLSLKRRIEEILSSGFNTTIPSRQDLDAAISFEVPPDLQTCASLVYSDPQVHSRLRLPLEEALHVIRESAAAYALIESSADAELVRQLEVYFAVPRSWLDALSPQNWRMRRLRKAICPKWEGSSAPFKAFRVTREALAQIKSTLEQVGTPLSITNASPEAVLSTVESYLSTISRAQALGDLVRKIGHDFFEKHHTLSRESQSKLRTDFEALSTASEEYESQRMLLQTLHSSLNQYFISPLPLRVGTSSSAVIDRLTLSIKDLDPIDRIDLHKRKIADRLGDAAAVSSIAEILAQCIGDWGHVCMSAVLRGWVDSARSQTPLLRAFNREQFTRAVERFRTLEASHRNSAREAVNNSASKRWNRGIDEGQGLSLLKKEASKQRKVLSPREIMERGALSAMMKLKPCWLMSPLSISQMLPMELGLFDTIIFDEASQVRVEDAVPAIFRAKTMVVVGDPKQMPPTNFFSGSESDDDDNDDDDTEIAPSILDLAAQVYPSEMLAWHYRSRSEALIAYSNRAFYGGRLIAVPGPHFMTEGGAISFAQVPNAVFRQKDGNPVEAEQVIAKLLDLLGRHPDKSFGVIAMGQSQMASLEAALDRRISTDGAARDLFERARNFKDGDADAGVFIKNLENVQGDERDVILISCGYAPPEPGKKLRLNFGPLSKQGGGRRLNVAITRAKQAIHVFTSFDPNDIPTDETAFGKNPDLALFGRYIKYAHAVSSRNDAQALSILNSFGIGGQITARNSSGFAKDVGRRLKELGYEISYEIGSSGFYIDIGVHHPVIASNFVLGIECDGALFHSTPYARDRDKIREELLKSRGWRIARVWSQDWSADWKTEVSKLHGLLQQILKTTEGDPTDPRQQQVG